MAALFGAIILISLTVLTEKWTKKPMLDTTQHALARNGLAEISIRNAEAIASMGMSARIAGRWAEANRRYMSSHRKASDVSGGLGAISKCLRMMIQSGVLAVGAWLVINQQASAGIIIAGSILSARALAPVDLAIANWKGFQAARQGWARLNRLLAVFPAQKDLMPLQAPVASLAVENVSAAPPGVQKLVVQDVSFVLRAGNGLGIIGPSASGKSSLARLLVGLWQPVRGHVRLDGAALDQWMPEALGRHVGYLPQNVELLAGTVAQNISRFEHDADPGGDRERGQDRGRARPDREAAGRLRDRGRRTGQRAVGRPGAAHRAGARALSRSVPGRARRAQFQSRLRRRRGAGARGDRACASAAASPSSSRIARARSKRSI